MKCVLFVMGFIVLISNALFIDAAYAQRELVRGEVQLSSSNWLITLDFDEEREGDDHIRGRFRYANGQAFCEGRLTRIESTNPGELLLRESLERGPCARRCSVVLTEKLSRFREVCSGRVTESGVLRATGDIRELLLVLSTEEEEKLEARQAGQSQRPLTAPPVQPTAPEVSGLTTFTDSDVREIAQKALQSWLDTRNPPLQLIRDSVNLRPIKPNTRKPSGSILEGDFSYLLPDYNNFRKKNRFRIELVNGKFDCLEILEGGFTKCQHPQHQKRDIEANSKKQQEELAAKQASCQFAGASVAARTERSRVSSAEANALHAEAERYRSSDQDKWLQLLTRAADAGHPEALRSFGAIERNRLRYDVAISYFGRAVAAGSIEAAANCALLMEWHRQDIEQAVMGYRIAATGGSAFGMWKLGSFTAQGKGVPQDFDRGRSLMKSALEKIARQPSEYRDLQSNIETDLADLKPPRPEDRRLSDNQCVRKATNSESYNFRYTTYPNSYCVDRNPLTPEVCAMNHVGRAARDYETVKNTCSRSVAVAIQCGSQSVKRVWIDADSFPNSGADPKAEGCRLPQ